MDRYIERKGLPLNDHERRIVQDYQKTLVTQGGTAFLTLSTLTYLFCRRFNATPLRSGITAAAAGIAGVSAVSVRLLPKVYQRVMEELPVQSELRMTAYNTMLEYNPELSNYVINQLHQKKVAEEEKRKATGS